MSHEKATYNDLAKAVKTELKKRLPVAPSLGMLSDLFEAMYHASLRTEEGLPISFHIVYLDPTNPDPKPPPNIRSDRWSFVRLQEPISVTVQNLIKVAKASDPRTSSLAVYDDRHGRLFTWGLVDQGNSYSDFVTYESESGFARPGLFQASIVGIGHLVAFIGMQKIAELRIDRLVTNALDIFAGGPVYDALLPGISSYLQAARRSWDVSAYRGLYDWDEYLESVWIRSLCRLLLRIQKYRHGGAVLITPTKSSAGLNVKYHLPYKRLRASLKNRAALKMGLANFSDQIWEDYLEENVDEIPTGLYLDESIARDDLEDNRRELDGTIWFISLLTRVDGLILLTPDLEVRGFGVEITYSREPTDIQLASNRNATKLKRLDYNHFGTRHRSMMRFCSKVQGAVGFVISQDGDVRAMTRVNRSLVVWENIKLQLPEFVRPSKASRKKVRP